MQNTCEISCDVTSVYLVSKVKAALTGKIILIICNITLWPLFIIFALSIKGEEVKGFIVPLLIMLFVLIFVLGRYTAWNFLGKEFIRISAKSISYSRSYGIIETTEKTIKVNKLAFNYKAVRYFNGVEFGKIYFVNYDEDDIPERVFETSILISKSDAENIVAEIQDLIDSKAIEDDGFNIVNLN